MTTPARTPPLHTARLTLEPLRASHAAEMFDGLRDLALYRYLPDLPPASVSGLASHYRRIASRQAPDQDLWCDWIVRRDGDRRCIGTVRATIGAVAEPSRRALVGIMMLPGFWRRGYGREAIAAMLDCLFGAYGCRTAEALVDTRNQGSLALMTGLGFRIAGLLEDADFFDGATSHEYDLQLDAGAWTSQTRGGSGTIPAGDEAFAVDLRRRTTATAHSTRGQETTS